jgi:transposase
MVSRWIETDTLTQGTEMNVHSMDLRRRILNHALFHSIRETARTFQVSPDTVYRLKKLFHDTGDIVPRPVRVNPVRAVSPEGELYLQALLLEQVDLTLEELCRRYEDTYGVRVGLTTMHNTLKRLKLTYKKKPGTTRSGTVTKLATKN